MRASNQERGSVPCKERSNLGIQPNEDARWGMRIQQRANGYLGRAVGRHGVRGESSAQGTKAFERDTIILHRRMVIGEFGGLLFARFPDVRRYGPRLNCHTDAMRVHFHTKAQAHRGHRRLAARVRAESSAARSWRSLS